MTWAWAALELLVNGLEIALFLFFVSSRLGVRGHLKVWVLFYGLFFFIVLSSVNWVASSPLLNALTGLVLAVAYGLLFLKGSFNERVFWPLFTMTLLFSVDLAVSFVFMKIVNVPLLLVLEPNAYRLLLIVLVKLIQLALIFLLYFKTQSHDSFGTLPGWLLFIIPGLSIGLMFLLLLGETLVRGDSATQWSFALASLVILILNILSFWVFSFMAYQNKQLTFQRLKLKQVEMQSVFHEELQEMYDRQRKLRHDVKNHLQVMWGLLTNEQYEALAAYLKEVSAAQEASEQIIQSGHPIVDIVLNSKISLASRRGIEIKVQEAVYPSGLMLEGMDLTALLSNLLDNAIEAVERINDEERVKAISVTIGPRKNYFMIRIINPTDGKVKFDEQANRWISTKNTPGHGLGISIVEDIVKKYDGLMQLDHRDDTFTVRVLLPIIY